MAKQLDKARVKRTGRKRRTLGWTLLTLSLLVAAGWIASRWWTLSWVGRHKGVVASQGGFAAQWYVLEPPQRDMGLQTNRVEALGGTPGWCWWHGPLPPDPSLKASFSIGVASYRKFEYERIIFCGNELPLLKNEPHDSRNYVMVLLWPIPLLLITPATLLLRSGTLARRRANTNACAECGYSLTGLAPESPCPECGQPSHNLPLNLKAH